MGPKETSFLDQLKYLIERAVALIQQVDNIEQYSTWPIIPAKQIGDVIIATSNILHEINYQKPNHLIGSPQAIIQQ